MECLFLKIGVKDRMRVVPYASGVDSFMYVMLCTMLNILFVVGIVSRYQTNQSMKH